MKVYTVYSKINDVPCFLYRKEHDKAIPRMVPADAGGVFSPTLFAQQAQAAKAIDDLPHGIGKACCVMEVEISGVDITTPPKGHANS
jgi:hypothetical protein